MERDKLELKQVDISHINPVDYFNLNFVQYTIDFLSTVKNVKITGIDSLTYVENKSDEKKRMIVIENGLFVANEKNGLNLQVNYKYTPFMIIQKIMFKDNFWRALNFVIIEIMKNESDYIRVGTKFYKKIKKVDRNGIVRNELKIWEKQLIIDDYGKKALDSIPKFNDFTIEPDNKNYKQVVGNNYNLYSEFEHKPCDPSDYIGDMQVYWTMTLMNHIFGEQIDIGMQYIKVLYDLPKQKTPILVLTSEERETGKTTFVDYLEMLFGANSVIINPENISNSFNGAYADKNLIMIEESKFENTQAIEKLKNLATQKKILVNTKFVQEYSIPFHGHIIITSNDENKFSKVDNPEIRYWVRKIPSLKNKANHNILSDMKKEIPYFLYKLSLMDDVDTTKSRQVFEADDLTTDALLNVKKESLPSLHKDIMILLDEHSMEYDNIDAFYFTASDLKDKWFRNNSKIEINYINRILKNSIELEKQKVQRYIPIQSNEGAYFAKKNGRPYCFKNPYFVEKEEEDNNETKHF